MASVASKHDAGSASLGQSEVALHLEPSAAYSERRAIDLSGVKYDLCELIQGVMDRHGWSPQIAETITGVAAQDFSRIRTRRISLFKVERLIFVLHRMGMDLDLRISVTPKPGWLSGAGQNDVQD